MSDENILNQARVITAKAMLKIGYITPEQYKTFIREYWIVTTSESKLTNKLLGRSSKKDHTYFDVVHLIHADNNEHDLELEELSKVHEKKKTVVERFKGLDTE